MDSDVATSVTAVMNKADYDAKMLTMLRDENTYRSVKKDLTPPLERNLNSMLLTLKQSGWLPGGVYSHLRSSAGSTPQLYSLPKVHKPDVHLRVRNSNDFAELISQQALSEDEVMVSFDVVSQTKYNLLFRRLYISSPWRPVHRSDRNVGKIANSQSWHLEIHPSWEAPTSAYTVKHHHQGMRNRAPVANTVG